MLCRLKTDSATVFEGDAQEYLAAIPENSVNLIITSSDYWRQLDHGVDGQIGMSPTPDRFINRLADVFDQCLRILVEGGSLFQIMADTQNNKSLIRKAGQHRRDNKAGECERRKLMRSHREKEPLDIPFYLSEELRSRRWLKRQNLIWDKCDQGGDPTQGDGAASGHGWILWFYKWSKPGRPQVNCDGFPSTIFRYPPYQDPQDIHPCPFPPGLARELIAHTTQAGDTVIDPFGGAGTVAGVALDMNRKIITGDLVPKYVDRIINEITGEKIISGHIQQSLLKIS